MILYFTNDSRQKKRMLETDYVEDIFDEIQAFFEEHHFRPHFLQTVCHEGEWQLRFESQSEYFIIEDVSEENEKSFYLWKKAMAIAPGPTCVPMVLPT